MIPRLDFILRKCDGQTDISIIESVVDIIPLKSAITWPVITSNWQYCEHPIEAFVTGWKAI